MPLQEKPHAGRGSLRRLGTNQAISVSFRIPPSLRDWLKITPIDRVTSSRRDVFRRQWARTPHDMNDLHRMTVAVSTRNKSLQSTSLRHYTHDLTRDETSTKAQYQASRVFVSVKCGSGTDLRSSGVSSVPTTSRSPMSTQDNITIVPPISSNSPTNTVAATQKFIFLKAATKESVGGALAPPYCACGTVSLANTQELASRVLGGGPQTPSPASHQDGVSGWVLGPRLTPDWCEASEGVVTDA